MVCQYRSCERNHSPEVLAALRAIAPKGVLISSSGCLGQCASGPTVQVMPDETWYCRVRPDDAAEIVDQHLKGDRPVQRLLHPRFHPYDGAAVADGDGDVSGGDVSGGDVSDEDVSGEDGESDPTEPLEGEQALDRS